MYWTRNLKFLGSRTRLAALRLGRSLALPIRPRPAIGTDYSLACSASWHCKQRGAIPRRARLPGTARLPGRARLPPSRLSPVPGHVLDEEFEVPQRFSQTVSVLYDGLPRPSKIVGSCSRRPRKAIVLDLAEVLQSSLGAMGPPARQEPRPPISQSSLGMNHDRLRRLTIGRGVGEP